MCGTSKSKPGNFQEIFHSRCPQLRSNHNHALLISPAEQPTTRINLSAKSKLTADHSTTRGSPLKGRWNCSCVTIICEERRVLAIGRAQSSEREKNYELCRTSMFVAPASKEFSISSLTAFAKSTTTCPEQIR
jgi:hypothetical protein